MHNFVNILDAGNGVTKISRQENAMEYAKLTKWFANHMPKLYPTYGIGNVDIRQKLAMSSVNTLALLQ